MPERYVKRQRIGYITKSEKSWCKEFSIIQWSHGSSQMYDIRKWRYGDGDEQCGKGISLNRSELILLREYIDRVLNKEKVTNDDDDMPLELE